MPMMRVIDCKQIKLCEDMNMIDTWCVTTRV